MFCGFLRRCDNRVVHSPLALLTAAKLCNNCYEYGFLIASGERLSSLPGFTQFSVQKFFFEIRIHDNDHISSACNCATPMGVFVT